MKICETAHEPKTGTKHNMTHHVDLKLKMSGLMIKQIVSYDKIQYHDNLRVKDCLNVMLEIIVSALINNT